MPENYLIIGNDVYTRESEVNRIRDKFLSRDETELNYSTYSPDDIRGIMDSLGTSPFLAERRVVLVKNAEDLAEESADSILSYLGKPADTSVLVMTSAGPSGKIKHYRKLSGLVNVIKADAPKAMDMKKRIRDFLRKKKVDIAPRAVDLIVELKGADTIGVKTELDKLIQFTEGGRIEPEHVEEIVGRSVKDAVFKLADAIEQRNAKRAFQVLNDLYAQKKRPEEIIGYLGWYLRKVQKTALLSGRGAGSVGIAAELGLQPWRAQKFLQQAKKYPPARIERWVRLLFETDRDIKTGKRRSTLALEMLLVEFLKG